MNKNYDKYLGVSKCLWYRTTYYIQIIEAQWKSRGLFPTGIGLKHTYTGLSLGKIKHWRCFYKDDNFRSSPVALPEGSFYTAVMIYLVG